MNAPAFVGDVAAVITISSGSPDPVTGIVLTSEGCGCSYSDSYATYDPVYCDLTQGGDFPSAQAVSTQYTIESIPPNCELIIDAVEGTVRVVQGSEQVGGLDALSFEGLFEWMLASRGACMSVCADDSAADVNSDTTVKIESYVREL